MPDRAILVRVSDELGHPLSGVNRAASLLDEGNTVPFIARYRKEATEEMDEKLLRALDERLTYLRGLEGRRKRILARIESQGKLTEALAEAIATAETLQHLDDLYLPFRPKRRTRAAAARELGLEPLAQRMVAQEDVEGDPVEIAESLVPGDSELSAEEALSGAGDILLEWVSENVEVRTGLRQLMWREGVMIAQEDEAGPSPYDMYCDFSESVSGLPPHRILAINRGEREGFLKVKVQIPEDRALDILKRQYLAGDSIWHEHVQASLVAALKQRLQGAMARECRRTLTERAEAHAIEVFGRNLAQLLMQAPIRGRVVMGIDPAFRTGCKVAVVDPAGNVMHTGVIYPHPPQKKLAESRERIRSWITRFAVDVITIGNGTASRETEQVVADLIGECERTVHYAVIDEAGASVYSASELAADELPGLDVSLRGAVSIARRIQDPLAELVKIDPRSMGVGMYQHDMAQANLVEALNTVVESCVNRVGVDVNTASVALLTFVSGLGPGLAASIVKWRKDEGVFRTRKDLLDVAGMGPKTFTQAAGFLRVTDGQNPLDNTWVHPESYDAARTILQQAGQDEAQLARDQQVVGRALEDLDPSQMAELVQVGLPTVRDIIASLQRPGLDPRQDMPAPILRTDILSIEALEPGQVLLGTVRNVVDFGAFVDIGVGRDGLVHISEMSNRYVRDPNDVVEVADVVTVRVQDVDLERQRIALSMKDF